MNIKSIRTDKILPGAVSILRLVDSCIESMEERSILVVTSKVISLCENQVVPVEDTDRELLIRSEAELYYKPNRASGSGYNFTIKQGTLIPASGIDVSNANGNYILWPKDSVKTANAI